MIDSDIVVGTGLRITAPRDELAARLALVARGVSTRTAVLVLGGIQLRAEAGRLHLAATDMEVSLRASLDAQVDGEGTAVVPGRLLLDISRSLPDGDVTVEHKPEEAVVVVTAGTATYRLHTYSAEDFPRLPDVDTATLHAVDREALIETVARVGRSASRDESRPVLTGILVRFEPGKIVMAATDSYRLAVKETEVAGTLPELDAIIPARALQRRHDGDRVQRGVPA
jgi:DNA polymerase-3 subunit beta